MNAKTSYNLKTYTAGVTALFSSRATNDFRINYSSNGATNNIFIDAFGGSTAVDLAQLTSLSPSAEIDTFFLFGGYGIRFFQAGGLPGAQRQWNLVDTLNVTMGRHQFKFGVDFRRLAPFEIPAAQDMQYLYFSKNSVQANNGFVDPLAFGPAYPLYKNFSMFAQDEWKVSSRLSLSLGLRWEVNPSPGVTKGLKPYTIQFQGTGPDTWGLAPQGTPLWQTTWYNFAPRLGIAYLVHNRQG